MQAIELASKTWKIVEKVTIPLTLGVGAWALLTLLSLSDRVTKLEQQDAQNMAQWRLLQQHSETIQDQKVELEVYKRMFEMLLAKDKLTIERVTLPKPIGEAKTIEQFRQEQLQLKK